MTDPRPTSSQSHSAPDDAEELSFEELMEALEGITEQLASGDLGIERAAELYEQAERLHSQARRRLEEVQSRIDRLHPMAGEGTADS